MKRLFTISLCIMLLTGLFPVTAETTESFEIPTGDTTTVLAPLPGEADNLLTNGDFELGENGKPEKWTSKQFDETAGAWLVSGSEARNGGKSVKLTGGEGKASYPFVQQGIPVEGGATYQLSLWLKKDGGTDEATTKLEFWASAVTGDVCVHGPNTYTIKETNGWEQVLYNFRAPYTATSVLIMPRIESESETVYYDDVKVYKVGPPAPVDLVTDSIFYYPEQKSGTAELSVSKLVLPDAEDGTAVFSLLDGSSVLHTETVSLGKNFWGSFSFDTKYLSEYKKEYTVSAVVRDKDENVLAERKQSIYKFARPRYLNKNGVWSDGKEVFTPVIAYKVPNNIAGYLRCQKAGITVVQGDITDLDLAGYYGLKVLVTLYGGMKPAGAEQNKDYTEDVVTEFKNDPRVFGWAIMDEPHLNLTEPMEDLVESYRIIRGIDDNHPVYICEASPQHFAESAKACDLLCTNPYLPGSTTVAGKMNTTHVYEYVQKARAASGYLKPVLSLNQAFTWYQYLPDGDAERHMIYQAMLAGATSHGYFKLTQVAEENDKTVALYEVTSNDIWNGICGFAKNEQADVYAHFVTGQYKGFSHYIGKDIMYHGYVKNGKLRLIVLNQSITDTVNAEIPLVSFDGSKKIGTYTAEVIAGGEGSFRGEKSVKITLEPYKAVVLEITAAGLDLEAINGEAFRAYVENIRRKGNAGVPNGSMEVQKDGIPTDFTFSGSHNVTTETAHDGKYSLCLDGNAYLETEVQMKAGEASDVWAYVKHTGKVQLSVFCGDVLLGETKEIQGDGNAWQKLMVTLPPQTEDKAAVIRIKNSTSGTAYVDSVGMQSTEALIRNGNFEGKMNDDTPAGNWHCADGFGVEAGAGVVAENDGYILRIGGDAKICVETEIALTAGKLYALELDAKGSATALEIDGITKLCRIGASPAGAETWVENFRHYFRAPETKTYAVRLYSLDGTNVYFDNVALSEIPAEGIRMHAENGLFQAEAVYPFGETAGELTFVLCAFTAEGKLYDVRIQRRETKFAPFTDEIVRNTVETGEIPALFSLELPESDQTASYKAFMWKGLVPVLSSKTVPVAIEDSI